VNNVGMSWHGVNERRVGSGKEHRLPVSSQTAQRALLAISLGFLLLFVVSNGVVWFLFGIYCGQRPVCAGFIEDITRYYESANTRQIGWSVLVGAVFGGLATALVTQVAAPSHRKRRTIWLQAVAGAAVGALGSQILMYPAQHCTYAPAVSSAQFRIGLIVTAMSALILLVPYWTLLRGTFLVRQQIVAGHFKGYGLAYSC